MSTQTFAVHAWLADSAGFYAGEIDSPSSPDDLATYTANAAKNGHTVIDKTAAGAKRPADRPAQPAPVDPLKATYAGATTTDAKVDVIAQKLGLK